MAASVSFTFINPNSSEAVEKMLQQLLLKKLTDEPVFERSPESK